MLWIENNNKTFCEKVYFLRHLNHVERRSWPSLTLSLRGKPFTNKVVCNLFHHQYTFRISDLAP